MTINVNTSEANKARVVDLTNQLKLGPENNIARIALAYSLGQDRRLNLRDIRDSKGKSYKENTFFGRYKDLYVALICQHYGLFRNDESIPKYVKMHVDDGLELIHKLLGSSKNYSGLDFLLQNVSRGVESIVHMAYTPETVKNHNSIVKDSPYFINPIEITVGKDSKGKTINLRFNHKDYNNSHIAIAGNTGTGKTRFALHFIKDLVTQANGNVNYIYLDFKGLKDDDVALMQPFFQETHTDYIDAPHTAFPVNPLTFIDLVNEKNKIMGISKFVNIISTYAGLGKNQEQTLRDATRNAFAALEPGEFPSLRSIYEEAMALTGDRPDKLREILERLSELEMFRQEPNPDFLTKNYYLSLSGDLPTEVRLTSVFLVINYIYNSFMNMENVPVEGDIKGMRYVFLIDEAHVIFKDKKSQQLLESMLREIRSKGVSIFLLSQGIKEFITPDFAFSDMCEMAILLDIKNKDTKLIQRFLGVSDKEIPKVMRGMEKLEKGYAVSNLKELGVGEIFEIEQIGK